MNSFVLMLLSLGLAGCWSAVHEALRPQAAFDLSCPAEQLRLIDLGDPASRGVEGCGRRARYLFVNGHWVLNMVDGDVAKVGEATHP